jgi:hypothetical protein
MPTNKDYGPIMQGDDYTKQISVTEDNLPKDITGWELWVTVKKDMSDADSDAVIQKHVTSHDDPSGGITSFTFTPSDTSALSGNYYYDIQLKTDSGETATPLYGTMYFREDITEAT